MKKELKTSVAILLATATLLVGVYWGASTTERRLGNKSQQVNAVTVTNSKLAEIWRVMERNYVDNIHNDTITNRIYAAMLSSLDPHSLYLTSDDLKAENESLRGNFEGIGVVIRMINDTVRAAQVIADGPSEKAGMIAGDYILSVDGITLSGVGMSSSEVVKLLRGPRKSVADIKIKRLSENGTRYLKIVRDVINTPTLSYSGMIDKHTGYIQLSQFGEKTHDEFCDALSVLKSKGMNRLVLDLRGNGGGLLQAAIGVCNELLPGKELIVYTQGLHQRRKEVHSSSGGLFAEGDLIVMINEYSASASEIVAGAIQDNDRGMIVGRRSFGKGLVQQQFELSDHSALQLTVSRYYTPSGRCIQRPYDKGNDDYYSDFLQQIVDGYTGDSILMTITDSTPYHTTIGRIVYGGGGIYPDHIISHKSDSNIVYYNMLIDKGIITDYVFDFVSRNGQEIKRNHSTSDSFVTKYKVSDNMLENVFNKAEKKGITRNNKSIAKYREEIRARIKAEIGNMLYSNSTFYAVLLWTDPELKEAMNLWQKQ